MVKTPCYITYFFFPFYPQRRLSLLAKTVDWRVGWWRYRTDIAHFHLNMDSLCVKQKSWNCLPSVYICKYHLIFPHLISLYIEMLFHSSVKWSHTDVPTLQFFHQYLFFSLAAQLSNWEAPAWRASALSSSSESFWSLSKTLSTFTRMMSTT